MLSVISESHAQDTFGVAMESDEDPWLAVKFDSINGSGKSHVRFYLEKKDLPRQIPKWKSDEDNPPVSAKRAIEIAKLFSDKFLEKRKTDKWVLSKCELIAIDTSAGKWCWRIDVQLRTALAIPTSGAWPSRVFVVLMDGTVIAPTEEEIVLDVGFGPFHVPKNKVYAPHEITTN
jgi:hypothetical protein